MRPSKAARTVFFAWLCGLVLAFATLIISLTGSSIAIAAGILTVLLIIWGPIVGIIWSVISGLRSYGAWKATLTDDERMAVNLAEAAAMVAAHEWLNRPEAREERALRKQALLNSMMYGGGPKQHYNDLKYGGS